MIDDIDDFIQKRLLAKWTPQELEVIQERLRAVAAECDDDPMRAAELLMERDDNEALNLLFETMRAKIIADAGGVQ